jgi:hypothetical protein
MMELKPTKFGIKPGQTNQQENKPDQFGQVHNNQNDATSGNVPSGMESRLQHRQSDVDSAKTAQHHTLGTGRNQSSPGDHIHDGVTSKKLGPLEMDPTNPGKTRPALTLAADAASIRAFLHNFIEFRDV